MPAPMSATGEPCWRSGRKITDYLARRFVGAHHNLDAAAECDERTHARAALAVAQKIGRDDNAYALKFTALMLPGQFQLSKRYRWRTSPLQ
jgi:hypothetical protein